MLASGVRLGSAGAENRTQHWGGGGGGAVFVRRNGAHCEGRRGTGSWPCGRARIPSGASGPRVAVTPRPVRGSPLDFCTSQSSPRHTRGDGPRSPEAQRDRMAFRRPPSQASVGRRAPGGRACAGDPTTTRDVARGATLPGFTVRTRLVTSDLTGEGLRDCPQPTFSRGPGLDLSAPLASSCPPSSPPPPSVPPEGGSGPLCNAPPGGAVRRESEPLPAPRHPRWVSVQP